MKPSLPFRPTLLAVAIATATSLAYSEETSTDTESLDTLDTLEVKGQTYRNTATKTQLDPEETPQAILIIDSENLNERAIETVSQATRYSAGIHSETRGGAVTRFDGFIIRGFANDTILYDGLPLLDIEGWNLVPQIDPVNIQQIEIFKGPTSTLYGEMPPGGMVNIISKSPQAESKHSVEVTVGDDNKKEVAFDSTGPVNESINYRVTGLIRQQDGQLDNTEESRITIAPSLDIKLSKNMLLNLNMYYQNDPESGSNGALPGIGTVYENVNGQIDLDTFSGDENWNEYEKEVLLLGYKLDHKINNTWSFLQNARFTMAEVAQKNTYNLYLDTTDYSTLYRSVYTTDESSEGFNIDNQLSAVFDLGESEHNVLLGIDYLTLDSHITYKDAGAWSGSDQSYLDLFSIDIYNPDNSSIDPDTTLYTYIDSPLDKEQLGFYVQDQVRLGQWVLLAGGRYDIYKSTDTSNNKTDQDNFSGRVGALYQFENGLSPFINYAQSFQPETVSGTTIKSLKPSSADQVEIGLKYQQRDLTASLNAFYIVKSNVIMNAPDGSLFDYTQVGEVTSKGLELEIAKNISSDVSVSAAYTLLDVTVTEDGDSGLQGNTPIYTPDQQFSAWLNYVPTQGSLAGASFGAGLRYVGETQIDSANSGTVPSYTVTDLSIGYDLAKVSPKWAGASVQLAVSNIFDEVYYSCYSSESCAYGADRSFELKGRYEF